MDWKRRSGGVVGSVLVEGNNQLLRRFRPVESRVIQLPQISQKATGSVVVVQVATESVVGAKLLVQLEQGGENKGGRFHGGLGGWRAVFPPM